jgi:signal transduction histidine kinase
MVEKQKENVTEKEELSKSIINNINAAVIFLNQAGRINMFNPAAEQLFSQSYANARNNELDKVLSGFPELIEFIDTHEAKRTSGEVESNEKIFDIDLNPLENIGHLIIIRDVTEEKRKEEIERRNSNFVMLGEMAAFLAHEVRNSLGVIYGYTKTIKAAKEKSKTQKVNKEINFLTAMMESFLNFSKPVTVQKKGKIDLVSLLKKVSAEKGIDVDLDREKIILESDPALIRSIFSNLLLNSKEAGADKIEVVFKEGKELEILFKDNGTGIDAENREKVWYPFFTTKKKGTGMGLAIIRKIVSTLQGEISLLDTGPGGTTFKVIFFSFRVEK